MNFCVINVKYKEISQRVKKKKNKEEKRNFQKARVNLCLKKSRCWLKTWAQPAKKRFLILQVGKQVANSSPFFHTWCFTKHFCFKNSAFNQPDPFAMNCTILVDVLRLCKSGFSLLYPPFKVMNAMTSQLTPC